MTDSLVSLRDLRVTLGGNEVLKGITTELQRGKIIALIGRNGSGKTTLLRAVLKEIPYRGRIEFHCGHKHDRPSPKHVGYVPQKLNVDARLPLTVRDFLALALQRWRPLFLGISAAVTQQMQKMLESVGAAYTLDLPVEKISGGELQRVLLALATQPNPELLLLDEPAAGIDFQSAEDFYAVIARLNQDTGVTIVLVSHEMSVVSKYAHHVLCLVDGAIACEGPPQEIVTKEMLSETFGGEQMMYLHSHEHSGEAAPKA